MGTRVGIVTLAQEARFQLVDDAGVAQLFILSRSAAAEPAQLPELQRCRTRVRVDYRAAPNLIALSAERITLLGEAGAGAP